tara:strand:+ start:864 stop:1298 length:435 start_codon:yes stop_codon:yes gene_type:complete
MSYNDSSNQSGDRSESYVKLDLIKRGWVVLEPSSRDTLYDFVVDRGGGVFETIQVKTLSNGSLTKIVDRSGEVVSKNGKSRNSHDYAAEGIEWLVGVSKHGEIHYYHHSTYAKIPSKSFSAKKYPQDGFPINDVPSRHTTRGEK